MEIKKIMRTELENGTFVSTVMFDYGTDRMYETMVFDNEDNMEELDFHRTLEYTEAIEVHMEFARKYLSMEKEEKEEETRFVIGGVYETASVCNSDCIFSYKVEKVTEKTVTIKNKFGKTKRCKIHKDGNTCFIFPEGKYSMCPVIETTDLVK